MLQTKGPNKPDHAAMQAKLGQVGMCTHTYVTAHSVLWGGQKLKRSKSQKCDFWTSDINQSIKLYKTNELYRGFSLWLGDSNKMFQSQKYDFFSVFLLNNGVVRKMSINICNRSRWKWEPLHRLQFKQEVQFFILVHLTPRFNTLCADVHRLELRPGQARSLQRRLKTRMAQVVSSIQAHEL